LLPVQIIGAGIGGLSAAIALARKGFAVEVHERTSAIREIGAGIQLGPNAFRAFERLGIQDAIEAITFQPNALVLLDSPSGAELCRQELGRPFVERFGHPYCVGYRADVQRVLLAAAATHGKQIALHLSDSVNEFTQDENGVTLDSRGRRVSGSVLIGADGLWSAIRQSLIGDGRPRVSGHVAYRAVLPVSAMPSDLLTDDVQVWIGPRHHLVCYKLRAGELFNIVAIFQSTRFVADWDSEGDVRELHEGFADACPRLKQLLSSVQSWRMWPLCDRDPSPRWSVGRVTLLGDAAHPTLPYLAQGACMAIEDAVCLANCLDGRRDNLSAALGEYANLRFPRAASVQLTSREMGEINHATGPARAARNRALAARDPRDYESNAWLFDSDGPRAADSSSFWLQAAESAARRTN
jgi:3-hydroxybenzoate 6-monooxygenase